MVAKFAHNNFPASHQVAMRKTQFGRLCAVAGKVGTKALYYDVLRIDFETLCVIHVVDVLLQTASESEVCYQWASVRNNTLILKIPNMILQKIFWNCKWQKNI